MSKHDAQTLVLGDGSMGDVALAGVKGLAEQRDASPAYLEAAIGKRVQDLDVELCEGAADARVMPWPLAASALAMRTSSRK